MRIIAGEFKRRQLKTADLFQLRPATDRFRETLFNILNNRIDFKDITVCDIYAGTGAMGFEALSRGAKSCHFVEKRRSTFNLIKENSEILKITEKVKIHNTDAEYFVNNTTERFDLIFADPPYPDDSIYNVYHDIIKNNLLNESGLLLIQRGKISSIKDKNNFNIEPLRVIGDDAIFLFERSNK